MKILFINDTASPLGGAEVVIRNVRSCSRHHIDVIASHKVNENMMDDYDLIHLHNASRFLPKRKTLYGRKYVLSLHDYRLDCLNQMKTCLVNGLTSCKRCVGLVNYLRFKRVRNEPLKELARKASKIIVHSEYMKQHYGEHSPTYLPIPLEVEEMKPLEDPDNREDYLFFSARCSPEKNPLAFSALCRRIGMPGVMALDYLATRPLFKEYIEKIRNPQIEIHYELEREELFNLYRHAYLTVHPHLYAEPFGIGSVNSVLLGTPLIAYPYGNLSNIATFTAHGYERLVTLVKSILKTPDLYDYLLEKTAHMRERFAQEFDSIKRWDEFYEHV